MFLNNLAIHILFGEASRIRTCDLGKRHLCLNHLAMTSRYVNFNSIILTHFDEVNNCLTKINIDSTTDIKFLSNYYANLLVNSSGSLNTSLSFFLNNNIEKPIWLKFSLKSNIYFS